jgi:hypothetical protein
VLQHLDPAHIQRFPEQGAHRGSFRDRMRARSCFNTFHAFWNGITLELSDRKCPASGDQQRSSALDSVTKDCRDGESGGSETFGALTYSF